MILVFFIDTFLLEFYFLVVQAADGSQTIDDMDAFRTWRISPPFFHGQ